MSSDAGGCVWQYSLELARALGAHGVEVALATMGEPLCEAQRAAAARIPTLAVHESTFRLEWMEDPWDDVRRAGEWLLGLEARGQPDIVHLNGYCHAALPWSAPRVIVAHECVLSWWKAVLGEAPPRKYARYRDEVQRGLRAADAVVAPTRAMIRALREHYGAPSRALVVPNGALASRYAPATKEPLVLSVGRLWDQAKNVSILASVAQHLEWPVYVAGSERESTRVRSLGLLDPDALASWMARAAICALPARYEPFGLAAIEAGLSGCALVLGDIPSLREIWGGAALFVPPDDGEALLDALRDVIEDEELRARLSRAARTRALKLGSDRMAERYVGLYRELVGHRPSAKLALSPASL
jgi:glycosyltransferase involved in cell wall biosynthesis